jgi:hypothetical protein
MSDDDDRGDDDEGAEAEAYFKYARLDMRDGINPSPWNWDSDDNDDN